MTTPEPADADARRRVEPVICYPTDTLPQPDLEGYRRAVASYSVTETVIVPPRDASAFRVTAGCAFRITSIEGPQVGDLNLWNAADPTERFFSGKTRALHGTHVTTGERLWSNLPCLRPMATIVEDTLDWYGIDAYGGGVHDVIGTRCDPYTGRLLSGDDVPSLLSFEPDPRPCRRHRNGAGRGRDARSRCAERLHVHRLHPRHRAILHEGLARPPRRSHHLPGRDRPSGRSLDLSGRRLRGRAFLGHGPLPPAQGRGPVGNASGRLDIARCQRLRPQPRSLSWGFRGVRPHRRDTDAIPTRYRMAFQAPAKAASSAISTMSPKLRSRSSDGKASPVIR